MRIQTALALSLALVIALGSSTSFAAGPYSRSALQHELSGRARADMTGRAEAVEVVHAYLAAFQAQDIETLAGPIADDVVLEHPLTLNGSIEPVRFVGKAAVVGYLTGIFNRKELQISRPDLWGTHSGRGAA